MEDLNTEELKDVIDRVAQACLGGLATREDLTIVLEAAKSTLTNKQEPKPWPQKGDECWNLSDSGRVSLFIWGPVNKCDKHGDFYLGNVFRTREAAEEARRIRRCQAAYAQSPGARGFRQGENNYGLDYYDRFAARAIGVKNHPVFAGCLCGVYFDTREQCKAALQRMRDLGHDPADLAECPYSMGGE